MELNTEALMNHIKKPRRKISLTVPEEMWDQLREHADGLGTTPSKLVEGLFSVYLDAEKKEAEKKSHKKRKQEAE